MSRINVPRVVLGGLAAGFVANVGDFVSNTFLLASEMEVMRQRLGIDPMIWEGTPVLVSWVVVDFVLGLLIVWTYAAIRPRLGPGPATAVTAGLVLYLAVTAVLFGFMQMGLFSTNVFIKAGLFSLVNILLASLVGGAIYREEDTGK